MPSFEDTVRFIQQAHEGQTDKQGEEYWKHPVQVATLVASLFNGTMDEQLAALLHDTVEDTDVTIRTLHEMGYSPSTIDIVRWVSSNEMRSGTYAHWIELIAKSGPIGAVKVKLADNMSNMREGVTPSLKKRYERSMAVLKDALETRNG
jgi:(p)ppGpp synthase/HD superfamily hydrolase